MVIAALTCRSQLHQNRKGSGFVQHGFLLSVDKLQPKLENISLIKGAKRLFSLRSVVEFVKGIFKMSIVAAVSFALIEPEVEHITTAITMAPRRFRLR